MDNAPNLLCIDDDERILRSLRTQFKLSHNVYTTTSPDEFETILKENDIHVIISDQRMPEESGTELLQFAKEIRPNAVRILLTGYADGDAIIDSVNKADIYRYISKPWDIDELQLVVEQATAIALQTENAGRPEVNLASKQRMGDGKRLSILYADKYKVSAQLLIKELSEKYDITVVDKLSEAEKAINEKDYDLAIIDLNLREQCINCLLHHIKVKKSFLPTILLSRTEESDTLVSLINSRKVSRVNLKPVSAQALEESINLAMAAYDEIIKNPEQKLRHLNEYLNDSLSLEELMDIAGLIEKLEQEKE